MKDPMEKDPREEKLPRWAQDTLKSLRRQVEVQKMRADEARMSGGPEDTDTILNPYDPVPVRLPKGERVRFVVGPNDYDWIDCHVTRQGRRGAMVQALAGHGLVAYPSTTNVVHMKVTSD